ARMQPRAADDLQRIAGEKLAAAGLSFSAANSFVTPRRLTLLVDGLPTAQPDVSEERRGPRVGAPPQAVEGFLKSAGISSLDQCEQRDTGKGVFYFANIRRAGRATADVLPALLRALVVEFPWPKSMRFPAAGFRWVRPLTSALCLFDGKVLPLDLDGVPVGATTGGHRFLSPTVFTVTGFADYRQKLRDARVILRAEDRAKAISLALYERAATADLTIKDDAALLEEVTGLVEWPVVLMGAIDPAFLDLPPEVLTTSMRTHLKYFTCLDREGRLAPRFLLVSNMMADDDGNAIVAGNERVLRARLSDARFFWEQDGKVRLASRVDKLKERVFHARLGNMRLKAQRIEWLSPNLALHVRGSDSSIAVRAAELCKADLSTGMVGEFPELQGIMGRYYALKDGEAPAVADAIAQHYSPLGPNDSSPTAPNSVVVALADKIDTLASFFAIEEKPTGSKDPFALRRAALGVIRIILENGLRIPLRDIFRYAYAPIGQFLASSPREHNYRQYLAKKHDRSKQLRNENIERDLAGKLLAEILERQGASLADDLLAFFADRLKVHLREQGVRHDLIAAVFALGNEDDLVRLLARVAALDGFLKTEEGANLLVAYRRAANIVRIEEKKDGRSYAEPPDPKLLAEPAEAALAAALERAGARSAAALGREAFTDAMAALAVLRRPVDEFFARVTVNCDNRDLRANRLRLLARIRDTLNQVADFSQIEG
ncbi:MAG TPA: glycine--tRNA ligase subunit beta, partial [Methyloceanibacter sp.]|nr:glycine--tRNA ligase subunit beta [Methyloceanibacter sp.]